MPNLHCKLGDADVFAVRLNSDSTLAAVSLFDGSLQIVDMMMGGHMHKIKDEQMRMPITSLTWKPTRPNLN